MRTKTTILLVLLATVTLAQKNLYLTLECTDRPLPEDIKVVSKFSSPNVRTTHLNDIVSQLLEKGYLTASIDSTQSSVDTMYAFLHVGNEFHWVQLKPGNASEDMLSEIGFREKLYNDAVFHPNQLYKLYERIITHYENSGYPFASVQLTETVIDGEGITATLEVRPNNLIQIDSVIIKGDATVSASFIEQYIGITSGDLYSEEKLQSLMKRLRSISFVTVVRAPDITFHEEDATLYLYLNKRKASNINGIIGVQPNNVTGKITITGDAKLGLKNAFKQGEALLFEWRQLQTKTQDLKASISFPFLFRSPFGADFGIKLYKRDTTFIEVNLTAGIQYHLGGDNYLRVFVNQYSSNLISTENLNQGTLPDYADVSSTSYGLGVHLNSLDYIFNPRSGFEVNLSGSTGIKKINKNPALDEELYTGLKLRSVRYYLNGYVNYFIPFWKTSTLMLGAQGGMLINESMFENEMFRFGGLHDLRGFDQESLRASSFVIGTIEYRLLFEENSNIHAFLDYAWYEKKTLSNFITDTPLGFGAGISFETKAGVFSLDYALGKQLNNPVLLKAGKVHFGFISLF